MKLLTEAFLDKWEGLATQRRKKRGPRWITAFDPDWHLPPTENYTLRLYLRQVAVTGLPVALLVALGGLAPIAYLCYRYPVVLHNPRAHKLFIGLLSHEGIYSIPWMVLFLLALNAVLYLPRFYFWNRRADRLRCEPPAPHTLVEAVAVDMSVWPPPPRRPAA